MTRKETIQMLREYLFELVKDQWPRDADEFMQDVIAADCVPINCNSPMWKFLDECNLDWTEEEIKQHFTKYLARQLVLACV
jgi:Fe-S cluster assembly iron-binding protein IscA